MNYINFMNLYKQNSLAKKKYYNTQVSKTTKILLDKFIELGLIKHVYVLNKIQNIVRIHINYIKTEKAYLNLKILYKLGRKKNINLQTLKKKKQFKVNSTFILLTSKGVLTNFEALVKNTGGVLLCQINY